ncbi:MAG TPA: ATP-binding protein [Candidatus Saccharibacteria bacterium]|nr:ATP-binding protein [Candidatus Saccharibacteria bacterium]
MPTKKIPTKPIAASLERERLTSLINSMADGVIAVDNDLLVVVYNGAALNILDVNTLSSGKDLTKVLRLLDKEGEHVNIRKLLSTAKTAYVSRDFRLKYQDGSMVNVYISIAPVHHGYGKNSDQGYVVVLRDITHEKSLEEERDEFISVVSHELRTPIAIAEGNLSNAEFIINKQHGSSDIAQAVKQAYDQVAFLSGMINDLSMLSRAERGKLAVELEDINVHDLVKELAESYQPQAKDKGLELRSSLDKQLELVHSSKLYVREILQNFITNALKYTEKGSVEVTAKRTTDGVVFIVQDTGIGISKGDQEKVFEKFFRSEDFRTRETSGTGLGLYVTAKLARILHAKIELESELNKGSTFRITIPNLTK